MPHGVWEILNAFMKKKPHKEVPHRCGLPVFAIKHNISMDLENMKKQSIEIKLLMDTALPQHINNKKAVRVNSSQYLYYTYPFIITTFYTHIYCFGIIKLCTGM